MANLDSILEELSEKDINNAISDYHKAINKVNWYKKYRSSVGRRYFLYDEGERIGAKALVKAALVLKGNSVDDVYPYQPPPFINALRSLGFPVVDEVELGEPANKTEILLYESVHRLARHRQQQFRREALKLWGGKCAVTGVKDEFALEAAHIDAHANGGAMLGRNSILLRADIHRLFDLGLLAIRPDDLCVSVSADLKSYRGFEGNKITLPENGPSANMFDSRWRTFQAN